jgi:S-adenosylmethionine hydrolase
VDLTHEIPGYNTWEAAYRLSQVVPYWPEQTVFVSVVDPGVGTERRSVVVKTKKGHYIVTPDNGTTTLVAALEGIEEVRTIDESVNRRRGSDSSFTFHGRDVYMYTAARLASGTISFEQVGPVFNQPLQVIPFQEAVLEGSLLRGSIPVLDPQYGNVWTNIPGSLVQQAGIAVGDTVNISVAFKDSLVYSGRMPFVNTFGDVAEGKNLGYLNSLLNFSLAINMGNFSKSFHVESGPGWSISIKK